MMDINKKITLVFFFQIFFFLSIGFAVEDLQLLPRPLPDEYYPPEPLPYPEPKPDPGSRISYSLGSGVTGRFGIKNSRFLTRRSLNKVVRIRLASTSNKNDIRRVIVTYADQNQREIYQLEGLLNHGEKRDVLLDGRPIISIDIAAAVPYFWKKTGKFKVDVTTIGPDK